MLVVFSLKLFARGQENLKEFLARGLRCEARDVLLANHADQLFTRR